MTLIPPRGYAEGVLVRKRKKMMYEILAQEMVKDALREADKNRLIKKAKQSRKIQNRQRLAKLARLFRLTQTNKYVQAIQRFENN
jgi:hypothetical protein